MTGRAHSRWLSVVAGLALALSMLASVNGSVWAKVPVTRAVKYDIIVDPEIVSLARIKELRQEGRVIDAWMTIIPEKIIPDTEFGSSIISGLRKITRRMSKIFRSGAEYNAAFKFEKHYIADMIDFSGARLKMTASFVNDPDYEELLRIKGFTRFGSKTFEREGETYTLWRWLKREADDYGYLGIVSAQFDLEAHPNGDSLTSEFRGNFERVSRNEISVTDLPEATVARSLARELYESYRQELRDNLRRVIEELNGPFLLLTDANKLSLAFKPIGTTVTFNRSIEYDWFGEKRSVSIIVKGTLGEHYINGVIDIKPIEPFKDD